VISDCSKACLTLSDFIFEEFNVSIRETLSSRLPFASDNSRRISFSRSVIVLLSFEILVMMSFFVISNEGASDLITRFKHYSSKPDSLTEKFTQVTLQDTSGV